MKKVIIFVLFAFLFVPKILASEYSDVIPLDEPIIVHSIEEKYKWYKLNKVNEEIKRTFEHNCEYFDEVESEFSEWSLEKPDEETSRIIEEKEVIDDIYYNGIILNQFETIDLEVQELELIDSEKKNVPYRLVECRNCVGETKNLYDKDINTTVIIKKNAELIISLDKKYTEDLKVRIKYDLNGGLFGWKMTFLADWKTPYLKNAFIDTRNLVNIYHHNTSYSYESPKAIDWNVDSSLIKKYYRFKDEFVNCYEYEKEYLDEYSSFIDGYTKDEKTKTIFYNYDYYKNESVINYENKEDKIEEVKEIDDSEIAINYGSKKEPKNYSLIPVFIIALGGILILLVLICRKIRLNLENSR